MISNLLDRMKLPFRKNKEFLSALYDILGFYPHDIEIYRVAFSHKSLANKRETTNAKDRRGKDRKPRNENTSKPLNNERLEYLGDAVLETVVSDILFRHYPNKREGFLTATRSKIVQREALNRLANEMGLERLIQAAQGTRMDHTNIGGNAFEALMGAIYLDRGYRHCHWFIANRVVGHYVDLDSVAQKEVNFKSKLLEWSQKNRVHIAFKDFANEGETKGFESTVNIEGIVVGRGTGRSKKESQQEASKEALTRMRRDAKLYDNLFRAKEKRTAMEAEESFALPKIDEIEDQLIKGKKGGKSNGQSPILEDKNKKEKAAPTPQSLSDAAYDTAYDADATYEVIDQPAEEPVRTAEDYEAIGLPAPPSENDLEAEDVKPTKRKSHTPRTVNDAVKGFKRNERTERPEEIKAAQQAERQAAKANKKKEKEKAKNAPAAQPTDTEKAQPKKEKAAQPKKEANQPATADEKKQPKLQEEAPQGKLNTANPTVAQPEADEATHAPMKAQPEAEETEVKLDAATVTETETAGTAMTTGVQDATGEAVTAEADEPAEAVTEETIATTAETLTTDTLRKETTSDQPEAEPQPEAQEVMPSAEVTESAESAPEAAEQAEEAKAEEVVKAEMLQTDQPAATEAFATEEIAQQEAVTDQEAIADDFIITVDIQDAQPAAAAQALAEGEGKKPSKRAKRKANKALTNQAEMQAEAPETKEAPQFEVAPDATDEATEADEPQEAAETTAGTRSEAEPRPILRHLSMDDFVFGIEQPEQPALDDWEELEEKPARKSRASQRRKKRKQAQAAPTETEEVKAEADAPQETLLTDWDETTLQPTADEERTDEQAPNKKPRRKRRRRPNKKKEE